MREKLRDVVWPLDKEDLMQVRCLGSLTFAQPLEVVQFRKFHANDCLQWLKNSKGSVLNEASRVPPVASYKALAIMANPTQLHPEKGKGEPVVGLGTMYISPYILGVPFSSAFLALSEWAEKKESLKTSQFLFVHLNSTSELTHLCVDYPVFLDPVNKGLCNSKPSTWAAYNLHAFTLQQVSMGESDDRKEYVMLPCTKAVELEEAQSRCCRPTEEKMEAVGETFIKATMIRIQVASPLPLHWTIMAEKKLQDFLNETMEEANSKKQASKLSNPSANKGDGKADPPKGGGRVGTTQANIHAEQKGNKEDPTGAAMGGGGVNVATPPPFSCTLSDEEVATAVHELLEQAHQIHIKSLYETGSVRIVDRLLAEALMTEFVRLGAILSEDLVASLHAFRIQIRDSHKEVLENLKGALCHLPREAVGEDPFRAICDNSESIQKDTTSLLATIELVFQDMEDFLQRCLSDVGSVGESEILIRAFNERFISHTNNVQRIVFSPAMEHWVVSHRVSTALATLQPLTAHGFTSLLSEVIHRLGLAGPLKGPTPGDQGELEKMEAVPVPPEKIANTLGQVLFDLVEADGKEQPTWFQPRGLHLDYTSNFTDQRASQIAPVLSFSVFDDVKEEIEQLRQMGPKVPPPGLPVLGLDELWKKLCNTPPGDWKAKLGSLLGLDGGLQPQTKPDPTNGGGGSSQRTGSLNQPAPQVMPKDPPASQRADGAGVLIDQKEDNPAKQSNPTPKGSKNKNNYNKRPQVEPEEDKADPTGPAKKAFKNAHRDSSLLEGLTIPSGVDVSTTVKLSLSCLDKAEDGSFCRSSPKGSSKAKGGPGGTKVKEENPEEEDKQNPDEGPDDAEDIKADEDDDWDDPKSKPGQRIGSASIVKKENNSNGKPKREKSFSELVRECRYKKFLLDTEEANLVKCALLGLEDVLIPTQEQVDQSCLFEEHPSDRTSAV